MGAGPERGQRLSTFWCPTCGEAYLADPASRGSLCPCCDTLCWWRLASEGAGDEVPSTASQLSLFPLLPTQGHDRSEDESTISATRDSSSSPFSVGLLYEWLPTW